jgi:four helix bundle protein
MIRDYRDLEVWQKAMGLTEACYRLSKNFPRDEVFGLTSQLRRAAVSVPANIAEGRGRRGTREFIRFIDVAYGSLMEVETHLQLADRLGYIGQPTTDDLLAASGEVGRMLNGLRTSLQTRLNTEEADRRHARNPDP